MNLKNVKLVVINYKLPQPKTCGCCLVVYETFPKAYVCKRGLVYSDCPCGNTMALAPERPSRL